MDKNKIVMIGPLAVAGILMLAILAAISLTNQAFAQGPTHLIMQVRLNGPAKTVGKVSEGVPVTISGRLWNENYSSPVAGATIIVDCDGEECGTSPTDSDGHYSVATSLSADEPKSTNIITVVTHKIPDDFEKSETTMTTQLCKDATWSFCGPTTTK